MWIHENIVCGWRQHFSEHTTSMSLTVLLIKASIISQCASDIIIFVSEIVVKCFSTFMYVECSHKYHKCDLRKTSKYCITCLVRNGVVINVSFQNVYNILKIYLSANHNIFPRNGNTTIWISTTVKQYTAVATRFTSPSPWRCTCVHKPHA